MRLQYARQLSGLVDQFVAAVLELVRGEIANALRDGPGPRARKSARRTAVVSAPRTSHRAMLTQERIIEIATTARRYVEAHPTASAHEIAVAIGVTAADLRAPLRCLVEGGILIAKRTGAVVRYSLRPDLAAGALTANDGRTADLEAVAALVRRHVEAHPRCRRGEIAAAVGVPSQDVGRALTLLVRGGILLREGDARGARYVSRYARTWDDR